MWHTRERTFVQMFLDFIIATFFSSHMMYSWEEHLTNHKSPPDGYCQKGWQHRVETIIFEHLKQLKTKPPPGSPTVISLSIVFNRGGCIEMSLWTSQLAVKRTTERLFFFGIVYRKKGGVWVSSESMVAHVAPWLGLVVTVWNRWRSVHCYDPQFFYGFYCKFLLEPNGESK